MIYRIYRRFQLKYWPFRLYLMLENTNYWFPQAIWPCGVDWNSNSFSFAQLIWIRGLVWNMLLIISPYDVARIFFKVNTYVFTCPGGSESRGTSCPNHSDHKCRSCDRNYIFSNLKCHNKYEYHTRVSRIPDQFLQHSWVPGKKFVYDEPITQNLEKKILY